MESSPVTVVSVLLKDVSAVMVGWDMNIVKVFQSNDIKKGGNSKHWVIRYRYFKHNEYIVY